MTDGGRDGAPAGRDGAPAGRDGAPADRDGPPDDRGGPAAGDPSIGDRIRAAGEQLPLAAGGFVGAVALLVPAALITAVTSVAADRGDPIGAAADMFFTFVTFGPGSRVVDAFVAVSNVSSLANVRPSDYPSLAAELGAALDLLQVTPEAALLLGYVAVPWIFYLAGRYLARYHATRETVVEYLRASVTPVAGALPVAMLLGLAFGPPNPVETVAFVGVGLPVVVGGLGGLSEYAFRTLSAPTSKLVGWAGVTVCVLAALVLAMPSSGGLLLGQRLIAAGLAVVSVAALDPGPGLGAALLLLVFLSATVAAGFLRAQLSADPLADGAAGAHLGASVALGYVGAVALLGVVLPLASVVIPGPIGATGAVAAAMPDLDAFFRALLLGGVALPLGLGAAGGYLAVWHRERRDEGAS